MKIYFENGYTVIDTESMGGHVSKYGYHGISYNPNKFFSAYIVFKSRRYYLGCSKNIEEVISMRKEAEQHRDNGTFLKWYKTIRKRKRGNNK